jgi:single-strand DNA-binding protein
MANFNKVLLMGNLTRDVELKSIQGGQSVAKIGLAVNRRWTGADGERKEDTTFVDCEAWGKTAETMAKFLSKGRPVFIEGRLKTDQWTDKETGKNRSRLLVVIENFQFVDSRQGGGGGEGEGGGGGGNWAPRSQGSSQGSSQGGGQSSQGRAAAPAGSGRPSAPEPMDADDIPF